MRTFSKRHEEIVGKKVVYNKLYYYITDSTDVGKQTYVGLKSTVAGTDVYDWIKIEDVTFHNPQRGKAC